MDLKTKANSIIKNHMFMAVGAGLIPVPVVDFVAVGGIQLDMIKRLADLYHIDFQQNQVKAIISALTGAGIARIAAGATKVIPIIGSILGGITMAGLSGASTYAVGEVFKNHFASGGKISDLDIDQFTNFYKQKFEEGKQMAKDIEKEQKSTSSSNQVEPEFNTEPAQNHDKLSKLKELAQLKADGLINDTEFENLKKEILS